jgi:hypothetical protein
MKRTCLPLVSTFYQGSLVVPVDWDLSIGVIKGLEVKFDGGCPKWRRISHLEKTNPGCLIVFENVDTALINELELLHMCEYRNEAIALDNSTKTTLHELQDHIKEWGHAVLLSVRSLFKKKA